MQDSLLEPKSWIQLKVFMNLDKEANWRQRLEKPTHGAIIFVAENDFKEIIGFALATLEKCNPIISLL